MDVISNRTRLWLNRDVVLDWLIAIEYGRVDDGQPQERWRVISDEAAYLHAGPADRSPAVGFRINSFWAWHLKKDRAEGYRESRRELAWRARKLDPALINLFLGPEDVQFVRDHWENFVAAWFDRSGNIRGVPERITSALCEGFTSTGGLEDLDREIERFRQFGRAGQTTIALRLHDQPMEALEIIGRHVVPALR